MVRCGWVQSLRGQTFGYQGRLSWKKRQIRDWYLSITFVFYLQTLIGWPQSRKTGECDSFSPVCLDGCVTMLFYPQTFWNKMACSIICCLYFSCVFFFVTVFSVPILLDYLLMSHKYGGCFTLLDLELPRISRAYPVERSCVLGNSGIDIVTLRECIIKTSHWQVVIKKQKK